MRVTLFLLGFFLVATARAEVQEIKAECNTWGGGHQRVQGTWDLRMVFVPGGLGMPDREEWSRARSQCFHDKELVDGQIPMKDRPMNGMVIPCTAQEKPVLASDGTWTTKWFYPTQTPFCSHDPYAGWMLCGANCIYPAEYYDLPVPPMSTTPTTMPGMP